MTQHLLATVSLHSVTGFTEDDVVNQFAIAAPDAWDEGLDLLDLTGPLGRFYNFPLAGDTLGDFISSEISRVTPATVRVYSVDGHLDGSPHGSPIALDSFAIDGAGADYPMPTECALAMTLRADQWDAQPVEQPDADAPPDAKVDRPRQRYTGKLYIGPLAFGKAVAATPNVPARPHAALIARLLAGGNDLQDQLTAAGLSWCVWSRKDEAFRPVTQVEVDNAFDTQRRRGVGATSRSVTVVAP